MGYGNSKNRTIYHLTEVVYLEISGFISRQKLIGKVFIFLSNSVKKKFNMIELYYNNGLEALKQRNFEQAITSFTAVLKIEKSGGEYSSGAYSNRAFAYYNLGEMDLSIRDFAKSIEEIIKNLDSQKPQDFIDRDKCLIEIIRSKSTIAQINIEKKNFIEAEMDYNQIIEMYKAIKDEKLIPYDLQICQMYSNRGAVRFELRNKDGVISDLAMAYIETKSNDVMKEILNFAAMIRISEEVKNSITAYSATLKKI